LDHETTVQVCFGMAAVSRVTYDPRHVLCAMQVTAKFIAGLRD